MSMIEGAQARGWHARRSPVVDSTSGASRGECAEFSERPPARRRLEAAHGARL